MRLYTLSYVNHTSYENLHLTNLIIIKLNSKCFLEKIQKTYLYYFDLC